MRQQSSSVNIEMISGRSASFVVVCAGQRCPVIDADEVTRKVRRSLQVWQALEFRYQWVARRVFGLVLGFDSSASDHTNFASHSAAFSI